MLALHHWPRSKPGGCNMSALLVLVCLLDALAAHIYHPSRSIREHFHYKVKKKGRPGAQFRRIEKLILRNMEWPDSWELDKAKFIEHLYFELRNPLVHEAGRDPKKKKKNRRVRARPRGWEECMVTMWGKVEPVNIDEVDGWQSWPEKWPIMEPYKGTVRSKTGKPFHYALTVVALYWAVKDIARQLSRP